MSQPPVSETCVGCCKSTVGASILNCNFVNIREECKKLVEAGIDFVHLDVMDGNFVDDITFGPSFVGSLIREFPTVWFEVHMMVQHPMKFIEPMSKAGVHRYIFHYEVTKDAGIYDNTDGTVMEICSKIRQAKMQTALAINPETSIETVDSGLIPEFDSFLIMTVRPGRGGQKFMSEMMDKVRYLRKNFPKLEIGLDGGCSVDNVNLSGMAGANRAVCGSSLLRSENRPEFIQLMRRGLFPVDQ